MGKAPTFRVFARRLRGDSEDARAHSRKRECSYSAQFWCNVTPFRINTCKSVSKQTTLTPFRINTYEKHRGGGRAILGHVTCRSLLAVTLKSFLFKLLRTLLHVFALFCARQKLNPFLFKRFRTLCPKTPGVTSFKIKVFVAPRVSSIPCSRSISHLPYTLPSSVSCKSFACHSYENTGGMGLFFPLWNVSCRNGYSEHSTNKPLFGRSLRTGLGVSSKVSFSTFNCRLSTSSAPLFHGSRNTLHG
jgi:hypothetical protein